MEISTFELLVKPIAPPPASADVARRVVQGYFLTVSNLEERNFRFRIDFFISLPNPGFGDPNSRILDGKVSLLYDIAGENIELSLARDGRSNRYFAFFDLPAGKTASVQLLPKLTPEILASPNPQLEIRGYASISLPPIFRRFTGPLDLDNGTDAIADTNGSIATDVSIRPIPVPQFLAQSKVPVSVLLTPEVRGTFLPRDLNAGNLDVDQISYSLPLASGKALNLISPEPGWRNFIGQNLDDIQAVLKSSASDLENSKTLVEALAKLETNGVA